MPSIPASLASKKSIFRSYWDEIRTLERGSLDRWPTPELLHDRLAVLQLEHGESLSQRI